MNKIVLGILAHVDAGKTTVAEALLYNANVISKMGRVDNSDAFLDTHKIEKERGITVYSKEANFKLLNTDCYLLDTPGHTDFASDMERAIRVLDLAILVVSGIDGVQSHTKTVWNLLKQYQIPTLIFVNKMDLDVTDHDVVLKDIQNKLSLNAFDFKGPELNDNLATINDQTLNFYLENNKFDDNYIRNLVTSRKVFPVYFGSALKNIGIANLTKAIDSYAPVLHYGNDLKCQIYKISKDQMNTKITHLKILGGKLKVKDLLVNIVDDNLIWEDKVNEIRLYSGSKYQNLQEANAGMIVSVVGLQNSKVGDFIGDNEGNDSLLKPVYRCKLLTNSDLKLTFLKIKELQEEQPDLDLSFNDEKQEIELSVMGDIQLEILTDLIKQRYDIDVSFAEATIIYKETILKSIVGYGHFEPLRHYAEVQLLIEPLPSGSGIIVCNEILDDNLSVGFQKQIIRSLKSELKGVLTNSVLTNLKITAINAKANNAHTSILDFKEASLRALRQGLMKAESILLEPYYSFVIEVPIANLGRVLFDLENKRAKFVEPEIINNKAIISGECAVTLINGYYTELKNYTKGEGDISLEFSNYDVAFNQAEIIKQINYNPLTDFRNPSYSIFCKNGNSFSVEYDKVEKYMHLEPYEEKIEINQKFNSGRHVFSNTISNDEIEAILNRTSNSNKEKNLPSYLKSTKEKLITNYNSPYQSLENYYVVDGYNVIFTWSDLADIAQNDLAMARNQLIQRLNNYVAYRQVKLIVVFDAYKVASHKSETFVDGLVNVVFTKFAQTADTYIEKFSANTKSDYQITVITSDYLEQIVTRASGALIISSNQFLKEIIRIENNIKEHY